MRRLRFLAFAALAVVVAGCGRDSDDSASVPSADTARPATVEVTAVDYGYRGIPDTLDAGVKLEVHNDSDREVHELVAIRLADDEERTADELFALPPDQLEALFTSRPATVVVAPPGEDGFSALGDGTVDEPGRYILVCFVPTGAEPGAYLDALEATPGQPPRVEGGRPHFTAGMYHEVTVR